jgi:DNA-binding transcriptional regulator PaaX
MEPTTLDCLIAFLLSARSTKIYRKILWLRMRARQKGLNTGAFNQHIYRLHKKGIIESKGDVIHIHQENLLKFSVKKNSIMKNVFPNKTERVLISFDIPETKKKIRDWFRNQIKYWDFEMIHKSLWLGYGPLPKEFNERLRQLGIDENIRVFRIRKAT